jgi:hypothetical protein
MVEPKKILPIVILTLVIGTILGYHIYINYISPIATEKTFDNYAESYLDTYFLVLDNSNLSVDTKKQFAFYNGYPYDYQAMKSIKKGAIIQFVQNNSNENSNFYETDSPIEHYICKDVTNKPNLAQFIRNNVVMEISGDVGGPNLFQITDGGSIIILSGKPTFKGLDFSNDYVLIEENTLVSFNYINYININKFATAGCFNLTGTLIDENLNVIIKSSNLKEDWSREQAEKDAIGFLIRGQLFVLVEQSRIVGDGYDEISMLVAQYCDNTNRGVYDKNPLKEKEDYEHIVSVCTQYGYKNKLISDLYSRKQQIYEEKHFDDEMDRYDELSTCVGRPVLLFIIIAAILLIPLSIIQKKLWGKSIISSVIEFIIIIIPPIKIIIDFILSIGKNKK